VPTQFTLPIVGTQFPNKKRRAPTRRFALELCKPGDPVTLRREPENPVDPHAIAVDTADGLQIGYVPADRAPYVGMQMNRGEVTAIFQGTTERGGYVRIGFDGEAPVLPPARQEEPAAEDWWPDEIYPDD
jgi:hypothetical protein